MSNLRDFFGGASYDKVDGVRLDGAGGHVLSMSGEFDADKWVDSDDTTDFLTTASWTTLSPSPKYRYGQAAVHYSDGTNDYMIIYGGYNSEVINDTWEYNITTDTWRQLAPGPTARYIPVAVHYSDGTNDYMIVYGGYNSEVINDTWRYNITTDTWTQLADGPGSKFNARGIHYSDGTNDYMIVYGATIGDENVSNTWRYNITTDTWGELASGPFKGYGSSTIHYSDGANDYMIIYGGYSTTYQKDLNETWQYNITTNSWTQLADGPSARRYPQAVYSNNDSNDYMIIYGGHTNNLSPNDTWLYNITTNTWEKLADGPGGRFGPVAIHYYNGTNGYMIMHGGIVSGVPLNETWVYDITTGIKLKNSKVLIPKRR